MIATVARFAQPGWMLVFVWLPLFVPLSVWGTVVSFLVLHRRRRHPNPTVLRVDRVLVVAWALLVLAAALLVADGSDASDWTSYVGGALGYPPEHPWHYDVGNTVSLVSGALAALLVIALTEVAVRNRRRRLGLG